MKIYFVELEHRYEHSEILQKPTLCLDKARKIATTYMYAHIGEGWVEQKIHQNPPVHWQFKIINEWKADDYVRIYEYELDEIAPQ